MAAEEALRPEMVQIAEHFLKSNIVKDRSPDSIRSFLSSKGLSTSEIEKAFSKSLELTQTVPPLTVGVHQRGGGRLGVRVLALFSKLRDFCSFAFFAVAAYYGLRFLYEHYVRPWLTGRPPPSAMQATQLQAAVTESLSQLHAAVETLRRSVTSCTAALQSPQNDGVQTLAASVNEMKRDVASLRSMLLKKTNFTPTPPIARSIPEWQKTGGAAPTSCADASSTSSGVANSTSSGVTNSTSSRVANSTSSRVANSTSSGVANSTSSGVANSTSSGVANSTSSGVANSTSSGVANSTSSGVSHSTSSGVSHSTSAGISNTTSSTGTLLMTEDETLRKSFAGAPNTLSVADLPTSSSETPAALEHVPDDGAVRQPATDSSSDTLTNSLSFTPILSPQIEARMRNSSECTVSNTTSLHPSSSLSLKPSSFPLNPPSSFDPSSSPLDPLSFPLNPSCVTSASDEVTSTDTSPASAEAVTA